MSRKSAKSLKVAQPKPPIEREILADAIVRMSKATEKLLASGINRRAIEVLLQAETGMARKNIQLVLDGLAKLNALYCR